jgi:hypothetical protein
MTKHIVGLILFSFIVGTSAFVAGLFYNASGDSVTERTYTFGGFDSDCKKRKKRKRPPHRHPHFANSVSESLDAYVTSATFDSVSDKFIATTLFTRGTPEEFNLDLHFFVRDEFGTRFIKTETLSASSWTNNYEDEFDWLTRFPQKDDLYVMAVVRPLEDDSVLAPAFDLTKATPIRLTAAPQVPGDSGQ